jgi:hypothetical protein
MGEKRILVTFDEELMEGVMSFKKRNGYKTNKILSTWQVQRMNTPIRNISVLLK